MQDIKTPQETNNQYFINISNVSIVIFHLIFISNVPLIFIYFDSISNGKYNFRCTLQRVSIPYLEWFEQIVVLYAKIQLYQR